MTACFKLKCEEIKQTNNTHFQYFTENGYLPLQKLIKVPAGGDSMLFWHIKHTVMLE
jgi:hypothetical protein